MLLLSATLYGDVCIVLLAASDDDLPDVHAAGRTLSAKRFTVHHVKHSRAQFVKRGENWETLSGTSPAASPKSTYGQYLDLDSTVLTIAMADDDLSPSRPGSKARSMRTTTDLSDSGEKSEKWDVASPTRNSNYIRNCSKIQVLDRVLREDEKLNADVGMKNKEELVNQLGLKYGSLRKAWQEVFDPYDTGKIGFQEFCDRMRAIGFLGDMKE
ncbi:hypothetical protein AK812_SmicGene5016 [Symbiodinium microadriaticum]|uniref:EF-hand domain-containing protein n=1 Tax=Symbiodinium microadriaticum TaxID=2951 RepID=A0A1Q9EUR5_SYMMI|nr:hypothetical protein AK812_SmicGene5016 [Symbiodinium microadriaticum]